MLIASPINRTATRANREGCKAPQYTPAVIARAALAVGGIVAFFILWDLVFTSDEERVEEATERLIALANGEGEEAVAAVLEALDPEYRGALALGTIESYLEEYVGGGRIQNVTAGGIYPFEKNGEWHVNLVISVTLRRRPGGSFWLAVSFVERDGVWRVIDLSKTWLK